MALQAIVRHDGYSYTETIVAMDHDTIQKSRELFKLYVHKGVIISGGYDDRQWTMTDEVHKGEIISFQLDEVQFVTETGPKLACTLQDYAQAMRIVITSRFGFSLRTLQSDAAAMRFFADGLMIPADYAQAQVLAELMALLPGTSSYRNEILCKIDDMSPFAHTSGQQRSLAHYQSYLRFGALLANYWDTATPEERVLYFPVWYWYHITGVLPLRPTECVLTPRRCIYQADGRYYLEVRRTHKKGTRQEVRYRMEQDYVRCKYQIPEHLAVQILEYIAATEKTYQSDIDVLFCKTAQFTQAGILADNDNHYTYANLRQCLTYFYRNIIVDRYGYAIVSGRDQLGEEEIGKIQLGDMRHIAMISLAISGGSPSICKMLAGHDSIDISSHYYSNLTTFLDMLSWERFREAKTDITKAYGLACSYRYPVNNGYCQSEQVWQGDYTPCESAVNADGVPGSCEVCRWHLPSKRTMAGRRKKTADALQETCILLRQAVDQIRQGLGHEDTISSILDRLTAQSRQYIHQSAIERLVAEREE